MQLTSSLNSDLFHTTYKMHINLKLFYNRVVFVIKRKMLGCNKSSPLLATCMALSSVYITVLKWVEEEYMRLFALCSYTVHCVFKMPTLTFPHHTRQLPDVFS